MKKFSYFVLILASVLISSSNLKIQALSNTTGQMAREQRTKEDINKLFERVRNLEDKFYGKRKKRDLIGVTLFFFFRPAKFRSRSSRFLRPPVFPRR